MRFARQIEAPELQNIPPPSLLNDFRNNRHITSLHKQHGVHYFRVHHAAGHGPQASNCYLWSHWLACRFHQSPPLHPTASQSLRAAREERMPAMSPQTSHKLTSNSCGNMDPKALGL
jgi:hypothetical protein